MDVIMKKDSDYKRWIVEVKQKIRSTQIKAAIAVNSALIEFYWDLGRMISEKEAVWGAKLIEQVSKDLREEFPDMQGLSRSNLFYSKKFYQFYNVMPLVQQPVGLMGQQPVDQLQVTVNQGDAIVQQRVALIPWGHNILICAKSKDVTEALFYIQKTSP